MDTQPQKTDREMLEEIYKVSKQTKNYMKWQLIITIAFVIIPLLATIFVIPYALKSLTSAYGLDSIMGGSNNAATNTGTIQNFINQYTK